MELMRALLPTEELVEAVGAVEGVEIVRDGPAELWVPDYGTAATVMDRAGEIEGLRVIQLQSAGYDGMLERLPAGVTLCNARGVHDDATAEHAVGLLLAALRGLPEAVRAQDRGEWLAPRMYRSLADSHVLVLGYGSIGRAVAERLLAMRALVTAVASRERDDDLVGRVRAMDALPDLLPQADAVVVLLPLGEQTRGVVDAGMLARLPSGAVVVNVARGAVVDTDAVLAEAGRLRFALDVTDPEPLPSGHPLWSAPDVLVTPHVAGGTTAMLPRMAALVRAQLERCARGEPLANVVSPGR